VLYKLRAIVLAVRSDGLVKANEEFTAWLRGDRSMPFGPNHEHVTVRLVDFEDLRTTSTSSPPVHLPRRAGRASRRPGAARQRLPLVLIEAKTPVRHAVSWLDGALQVHDDYEKNVPELFVCQRLQRGHRGQGADVRLRPHAREPCGDPGAPRRRGAPERSRAC
jgi:type I restriction enzyme R subunit